MSGILFATHGGATADGACRVAMLLAKRLRTRVQALCVVDSRPIIDGGFGSSYPPTPVEIGALCDAQRSAATQQLRQCGETVSPEVIVGPAAYEIASAARRSAAELIVVGLGRHNLLDRALGGETAFQLTQLASTPVLAVPQTTTTIPRNVLAAIDFSPTSIASARACARWLVAGDTLTLVHAAGRSHEPLPPADRITLESLLGGVARGIPAADGVTVNERVVDGDPAAQILSVAASTSADLIVMGSHGYGLWKRLAIGSVASKVLRLSPVAVLVTPLGSLVSHGATASASPAAVATR